VRGEIRSLTFVFNDGTIRTLSSASASRNRDSASPSQGGLGWISDSYGIPCVSGERRSNAQQYLGSQTLITAAGAGAASLIKSDRGGTAVITSDGNIVGTVGLTGQEAMGRILASGVQDLSQWVNKLYGQAFAAIYVQPGARVAVHIEQPLTIDYDTQGRRVLHLSGGTHVSSDLD
jgi:integrating conjugative element protein (TIGR03752 family)